MVCCLLLRVCRKLKIVFFFFSSAFSCYLCKMRCSLKARWPTGPAVTRHFVGICELFQIKAHSKFCSCGRNCSNIRLNCVILCDLLISIDNWLRRDCLWQSTKKQKFQIERKKGELCVYVQKCCCVFGIFFCCSSQNCYRAMFGGRNGASNDPEIDIFINFERSKPVGTHFVAREISEHHSQSNVCAAVFFSSLDEGGRKFLFKIADVYIIAHRSTFNAHLSFRTLWAIQ